MPTRKKTGSKENRSSFECRRCDRRVRIPAGWSLGPAVRRHYWKAHRGVMQAGRGKR